MPPIKETPPPTPETQPPPPGGESDQPAGVSLGDVAGTFSGNVLAGRDLKVENLTVVLNMAHDFAGLAGRPERRLHLTPDGGLELRLGEQPGLLVPAKVLQALEWLPHAVDLHPAERRQSYAFWLMTRRPQRPPQLLAAREHYVPLEGYLSHEEAMFQPHFSERHFVGEGAQRRLERERLPDVTEAVKRHPAFVLLGPPGSGKSTVLQRLAFTTAANFLTGAEPRLPLWVNLADYAWPELTPLEFVRRQAAARLTDDLEALLRQGQLLLLVDGLNEMLRLEDSGQRRRRANAWERFVADYFSESGPDSSRIIIASRDRGDYDQPLGLPRVEIEPLDDAQIERFVQAYLPESTGSLLLALDRLELRPQARTPFHLFIFTQLYDPVEDDLPPNRGRLFAEYARRLLHGERQAGHAWYEPDAALAALAELGYAMHELGERPRLPAEQIKHLLPPEVRLPDQPQPVPTPPQAVFQLAERAGLLLAGSASTPSDLYEFSHQLLQEHFAARSLLARWQAGADLTGRWATARRPAEMPDPYRDRQADPWDPLPAPPPTGWEQATFMAAGLAEPPDDFVRAVLAVNPALAGRCLVEGAAPAGPDTRRLIQQALLADLGNPTLHRRTRLQAGQVLGAVGDPRFVPVEINGVRLIVPDLVAVPPGPARLGSHSWPWDRQAYADERPRHPVAVAGFYLARTPLTNAEYACFIAAGGYDRADCWTPAGRQWRQGQGDSSGPVEQLLELWDYLVKNPRLIEQRLREGAWTPDNAAAWRTLIRLSREEARHQFEELYPNRPHEQPYYWDDPAYNRPNQPVVGVTWYEAMAYCAWLHQQLAGSDHQVTIEGEAVALGALLAGGGWQVRLPGEAEWEWAAGGPGHTRYPWGRNFDPERANTLEGRVLGPSPVGVYPAGAAKCGALDLSGNVWEWCHSLYRPYPYRAGDGREEPLAEGRRTLRGGSWGIYLRNARVAVRTRGHPGGFSSNDGLRVVVAPIFP